MDLIQVLKQQGISVPNYLQKRNLILNTIDNKIHNVLNKSTGKSTKEIADTIGISTRATRARLSKLVNKGVILAIGKNPQDPKRKYFLKNK